MINTDSWLLPFTQFPMAHRLLQRIMLGAALLTAACTACAQQPVFRQHLTGEQQAIPYPFLREADVVWSTTLWKTIDLNELFNQYIYFPDDIYKSQGKKSLANVLWDAVVADEITIYEDENLLIPIDNAAIVRRFTKPDTLILELGYDDGDEEQYETVIKHRDFEGDAVYWYHLREVWFVGKQDSRQDSRRIALAPVSEIYRPFGDGGQEIFMGTAALFWVPMQDPRVRNLLARNTAYIDQNNIVRQPSWDYIFVNQVYSAYITKESNPYDRSISQYLTGEDVIWEAAEIEERLLELENDMWEY